MISNCTLGSGSVLTPRRPVYAPGEVACGAYCAGALRRDCAETGEAITATMPITVAAIQIRFMAHLRCHRHLVRRSIDCNQAWRETPRHPHVATTRSRPGQRLAR